MVSTHRLSVTKDWPEYKNIISFLKRRTQTWRKIILQCFKSVLGRRRRGRKETQRIFDKEFKTNRRAEALWKYCMQSFHFHILRSVSH